MQFRFSVLFGCLLATTLACASSSPSQPPYQDPSAISIVSCEFRPPTDFHVIQRGPTSIKFGFVPFSDLTATRIKIYRESDDFLLENRVIPAGLTNAYIDNLPLDVELYATSNTICEDGTDGPSSARLEIISVILDLIVAGYTPGTEPFCSIQGSSNACSFFADGTITPFKITFLTELGYDSRQFGVQYVAAQNKLHTIMGVNGNEFQRFKLYCDNGISPCFSTQKVYIKYVNLVGKTIVLAEFELLQSANACQFNCLFLNKHAFIERMASGPFGRPAAPNSQERNDSSPSLGAWVSTFPNPFSDNLDIHLGDKIANQIQLQLYNLSGQKVLDQQFPAGQDQYTLSTEKLQPGFYLLRIEAEGAVQTLKVIKSE